LQDIVLFESLISDLFPDTQVPDAEAQQLSDALTAACWDCGLQPAQAFLSKALQLHDTLGVRFGVMLVGPAGGCAAECQGSAGILADTRTFTQTVWFDTSTRACLLADTACYVHGHDGCGLLATGGGKTACYRSLQVAQTSIMQAAPQSRKSTGATAAGTTDDSSPADQGADSSSSSNVGVQAHVLNPKSVTLAELYGSFNTVTNEWTDGLASRMIRAAVVDSAESMHWVVFDGPVDAGWVESMNTGASAGLYAIQPEHVFPCFPLYVERG
jgi:hypothetical protein